ncbi:MAG: biosynthetic arginine decarboxylase [Pirellulaceae bacterium]
MSKDVTEQWTTFDSSELYSVSRWGGGYFSVGSNGHLKVHPSRDANTSIDLRELLDQLLRRGIDLPVLVRFSTILKDRIEAIQSAFHQAMREYGYRGNYSLAYPVKVNPHRQVLEEILRFGGRHGFGVEAGSKPELLAAVAMTDPDTPIICNGFKDSEFVEMAMLAQKTGRHVIPVIEKYTDLALVLRQAQRAGVRPRIGVRIKLATRGSGRWQMSSGYRSKFGLSINEMLSVFEDLKKMEMADCLNLLHFHLGSQITSIRTIKNALIESARIYADLVRNGAGLEMLDVGGGLGIDYDGSQTDFVSSANYTLQEYANDVVYHVQTVCDDSGVPHPHLVSESGRAVTAYHSVLLFNVLGATRHGDGNEKPRIPVTKNEPQPIRDLRHTLSELNPDNLLESYHDAQQWFETAIAMFNTGYLSLTERGLAENLYWTICREVRDLVDQVDNVPEELMQLDQLLCDIYFCNFSLFQSLPDSWAIKQLFPVMPIERLDERPTRLAVLADITCDSDGRMDQFINRHNIRNTLPLHSLNEAQYVLGVFLVGAYQEILGDLHNLFGDTNAAHVNLSETGEVILESVVGGDTVSEVLSYVQFHHDELLAKLRTAVHHAEGQGHLKRSEAERCMRFYEEALNGYTYLESEHGPVC